MDAGLSQGQFALRTAQKIVGVLGGGGEEQGERIGAANVLGRHPHQAPGDEQGIFAAVQHPRQPVEGRVRV